MAKHISIQAVLLPMAKLMSKPFGCAFAHGKACFKPPPSIITTPDLCDPHSLWEDFSTAPEKRAGKGMAGAVQ